VLPHNSVAFGIHQTTCFAIVSFSMKHGRADPSPFGLRMTLFIGDSGFQKKTEY